MTEKSGIIKEFYQTLLMKNPSFWKWKQSSGSSFPTWKPRTGKRNFRIAFRISKRDGNDSKYQIAL